MVSLVKVKIERGKKKMKRGLEGNIQSGLGIIFFFILCVCVCVDK